MDMPIIEIDIGLCDGCAICVSVCPSFVLELSNKRVNVVNPEACLGIEAKQLCQKCIDSQKVCTGCIACVRNCPTAAITIIEASS